MSAIFLFIMQELVQWVTSFLYIDYILYRSKCVCVIFKPPILKELLCQTCEVLAGSRVLEWLYVAQEVEQVGSLIPLILGTILNSEMLLLDRKHRQKKVLVSMRHVV